MSIENNEAELNDTKESEETSVKQPKKKKTVKEKIEKAPKEVKSKASKVKKEKKVKATKLIIVESPAKAKTINRYLGNDYKVVSCMGHIIDLPKSRMAIDVENNFEPDYITVRGKGKILQEIKRYGKDCAHVFLAPDPDREGEAIAFHLNKILIEKYPHLKIQRVVFNEITKDVIKGAINDPREIDQALVNAQKGRRVLDRIVGYNISPLLWEKLKKGLSAGRVQSVALNLVCKREEEIEAFVPEEYWTLDLGVTKDTKKKEYDAPFFSYKDEKLDLKNKEIVDEIMKNIEGHKAIVEDVQDSKRSRKALPPYITSKLQQDSATRLGFSSAKTMMIAQRLYEGVSVGKEVTGLITYMRTDSVRTSDVAIAEVREYLGKLYGEYLPETPNLYKTNAKAQDAHEAIRPTSVYRTPDSIKDYLTRDEYKLYSIIWERFVSSQMKSMEFSNVKVVLKVNDSCFTLSGSVIIFDGFSKVFNTLKMDSKSVKLPVFEIGEVLDVTKILPEQHYTKPPARYSDASIVKTMEESGIGRPSTYAPTIERIIKKYYVRRVKRQLVPTMLGNLVNGLMEDNFQELLDINFTANMEEKLDKVAENELEWTTILHDFYPHFKETLEHARENIVNMKTILDEETDQICPLCGKNLLKKLGKFGFFLACSGFPDCRHTESLSLGTCPIDGCGGKIIARKTKKGRDFYGCSKYPDCEFLSWDPPIDEKCPQCQNVLFETGSKKKGFSQECLNPKCGFKREVEGEEISE